MGKRDHPFRQRTLRAEKDASGEWSMFLDDRPYLYTAAKYERTDPPGSLSDRLHQKGDVSWEDAMSASNMLPAYKNRDARLALMDEQGLAAAILLPTTAVCVEHSIRHDTPLTYATLRAFNRWLEDDWGYAYRNRIFAIPLLSLLDVDMAVEELERVLREGARAIHLKPGPVGGRSPADPHFDPFWERVNEARAPVAFHISDAGYNELYSIDWGEDASPPVRRQSAFQWCMFHGDRPIMDTLAALVFHNLFDRYPNIKVMSIENGSGWVEYLVRNMDKKKGMGRYGRWIGGRPKGRLSDIFRRHVFVTPYPEDDVPGFVEFLGADNVLFGSDYPHPEGLKSPLDFTSLLDGVPAAQVRKIMSENVSKLLGVELAT
jgi:predicted TIM-barrel fold metal-dependent hydrolase